MKLSEFTQLLQTNPGKPFHLVLPGDRSVPVCFHVTEVGYVQKKFIDCGGKVHNVDTCLLQAWVYLDVDHRLLADKMVKVLDIARNRGVLPEAVDLDVEIEYEDEVISQYTIAKHTVTDSAVIFELGGKHTDCLAKGVCLPSLPVVMGEVTACCGSGCC